MALEKVEKNVNIDVIDKGDYSVVGVRKATIILDDGVELSRKHHRHVVLPTTDVSAEDADVAAICNVVFTAECIAAYEASLPAEPAPLPEE